MKPSVEKIPRNIETLFWDVNPDSVDLVNNMSFVIERILEYGRLKDIEWLFSLYEKDEIIKVLRKSKRISSKSGNYFYLTLNLEEDKENFECFKKPYTIRQERF
ncbi:MAG TPA: hypothetical protein ENN64_00225 [bacterium]|nr:hypothetical protein [bacterium]